ncbi:PEPxxWA-CTERM sorting domain-containing protein [Sphingomonas bacterium]|uniref:PEPxxWA-CTERM sorting domain-containing protein n=1 Tax=Sphingomonas bacterium TaxID=1895847 RepID=UPI001576EC99|nr:PEPxxWA-CTERM sorting domain-containing protein [Sphingomonas bacterium]
MAASFGLFAVAAPASAAVFPYGFDFTASSSNAEKLTSGSFIFTSTTNPAMTATVTAWNVTPQVSGNATVYKLTQATLGYFQGGLGVTSTANDNLTTSSGSCGVGACNTHQLDNMGSTANSKSYDFLQITFSAPVTVGSVEFNAFGSANAALSSNTAVLDDDFSYGKGTALVAGNNNATLSTLAGLFQTNVGSNAAYGGATNTSCQDLNGDGVCNNVFTLSNANSATANSASSNWYIAASIADNYGGDGIVDGFKLASVNVYAAVPEPASWSMMILGFGAIGAALRRRNRVGVLAD